MLHRHAITYKRATKHFQEQKHDSIPNFLRTQAPNPHSWLALDECSFTLNLAPAYAYSKKGSRAVVSRPGSRGQRLSLILCIAPSGCVLHRWQNGGVNAVCFQKFLDALPPNTTIVMDNASTHHASHALRSKGIPTIQDTATAREQRIVYLPPYCPQLNPTELCFNVLKGAVRRHRPRSVAALTVVVDDVLAMVDMAGFFRHCWPT
jgi:hypothetical protein